MCFCFNCMCIYQKENLKNLKMSNFIIFSMTEIETHPPVKNVRRADETNQFWLYKSETIKQICKV